MSVSQANDERRLVEGCIRREEAAWREFVRQYGALIHAQISSVLPAETYGPAGAAHEEAFSEVLLTLLKNNCRTLTEFRFGCRLSTYLSVVARRVAINLTRREGAEARKAEECAARLLAEGIAGPDHALSDDLRNALENALSSLSPRDRLVISLRFEDDLDYKDIARALGVAPNSIGPTLSRALDRLKTAFHQEG